VLCVVLILVVLPHQHLASACMRCTISKKQDTPHNDLNMSSPADPTRRRGAPREQCNSAVQHRCMCSIASLYRHHDMAAAAGL
jgi:hypothetical protein